MVIYEDLCEHGMYNCRVEGCGEDIAWDRAETDPCERGTVGCSVAHGSRDTNCLPW